MEAERVIVKTDGESNVNAQGSEIWIVGVMADGRWYPADEIFDHTWLKKGNRTGWNSYMDPSISKEVRGRLPAGKKYWILVFEKNRWRGKCYINYAHKELTADCYADAEEGLLYVEL